MPVIVATVATCQLVYAALRPCWGGIQSTLGLLWRKKKKRAKRLRKQQQEEEEEAKRKEEEEKES